jgi:hypothetical protein
VIVHDLYVVRISGIPSETQAPLLRDTNRMLSFSIASELLQVVTREQIQVLQRRGGVQDLQFLFSSIAKCSETWDIVTKPEALRVGAGK